MSNFFLSLAVSVFSAVCFSGNAAALMSSWQDIGGGNTDLTSVVLDPGDSRTIYAGSKGRILKSCDAGISWRSLLSAGGRSGRINFLYIDPHERDSVYAASSNGLYYSPDCGKSWRRIFKGNSPFENDCRSVLVSQKKIYLATAAGLFLADSDSLLWHKAAGLDNRELFDIIAGGGEEADFYLSSSQGVFRSVNNVTCWRKTFFIPGETVEYAEEGGSRDENRRQGEVHICALPVSTGVLYLASPKGIYKSMDKGESWRSVSGSGFIGGRVRGLVVSDEGVVYAFNSKRVFKYSGEYWEEIATEARIGEIRSLSLDRESLLYLASSGGLFKSSAGGLLMGGRGCADMPSLPGEPDIKDVQKAAIEYAEVSPEKIARWRRQAALKAWFPRLNAGIQREASDLWHWEGGSTTKCDDDTLRKGRDYIGWDVTLSWELGDLIWNNDQTSIDARSKLMVELRDDILDNVTKLYFERLRLKTEIDSLPIEERRKRMDKELKMKEVTASLDAFTGGYFSRLSSASGR